jgi:hypothetical protein
VYTTCGAGEVVGPGCPRHIYLTASWISIFCYPKSDKLAIP